MEAYLILIFIFLCFVVMFFLYDENVSVKSDVDNNYYLIRRGNMKGEYYLKQSANTLGEINKRIVKLIDHLYKKYQDDMTKMYFIKKLQSGYNSNILSEAAIDSRYTTYTIDKQDMHVCLRTRDKDEKLYDINLLMYVILHELAHLCNYDESGNPIEGHGKEFKEIFYLLVVEAVKLGVYTYTDYTEKPQEYCGIMVSSTILPKFDYKYI
jgi:hypothetical protein